MEENLDVRQLDLLIRNGQSALVRLKLSNIKKGDIERRDLVEFADIARRVQMPELIIRWLRPVVRPEQPVHPKASSRELATYALGLSRIGVFKEALEILKSLPTNDEPQILYYLGLVCIEQWDYSSAQSYLQKYVLQPGITDYQQTVGLLNLAACYVSERYVSKADQTLLELLRLTENEDRRLLRANTFELLAQNKILQNQLEPALEYLEKAQAIFGDSNNQYEFFVRKWQSIARFVSNPHELSGLMKIRQEAFDTGSWETVRECDFFRSVTLKDESAFLNVYFGSHFKAYKKRILKLYAWHRPLPIRCPIEILKSSSLGEIFHLNPSTLRMPPLVRDLLQLLISDLYRPFSLSQVFGELYPTEYFNPQTSVDKVERLAQRLRRFLKTENIPLELRQEKGKLYLTSNARVVINVSRIKTNSKTGIFQLMQKLRPAFQHKTFNSTQVSQYLQISDRTARRLLKQALKERYLRQQEGKRGPSYSFRMNEG
ncbi:MAG: hypothetical protein ACXWC9_04820, partial [Pseudobdellovibrionaceae bacterium]